jgi:UDP-perosamine 4-acetyltransferase
MIPVVVLGSGGHAAVVIEILEAMGGYEIAGLLWEDDRPDRAVLGHPVIGDEGSWPEIAGRGIRHAAIGIGGWDDNAQRRALFERALSAGFEPVTAIHPAASISSSATVGAGSTVCAGVVVGTGASIGDDVILAVGATVEHAARIGDHALVSNGAHVGAGAVVGDEALVAIGAVVAGRTTVGERSVVAAGAVVVDDVAPETRVRGVPARPFAG